MEASTHLSLSSGLLFHSSSLLLFFSLFPFHEIPKSFPGVLIFSIHGEQKCLSKGCGHNSSRPVHIEKERGTDETVIMQIK